MSLTAPTALLFDLDGTLVDSVADLAASANFVRAQRGGQPLSEDVVREFVGDGAKILMERVVADLDLDPAIALREFRAHYGEHCTEQTVPYPGVSSALGTLPGIRCAVVSNKPQDFTDRVVDGLDLRQFFAVVVGARTKTPVKPHPALLEIAMAELKVEPKDCWMVGDSPNDLLAARAAGCAAIGVSYGLKDRASLEEQKPDALLDDFPSLMPLLEEAGYSR
jgi:phosphoglycolate phosphatase